MKNILFMVAEEMRADALACYGNDFCLTPHLDALAARGVRFSQHCTVHGKCVPSRSGMLTGSYPSALGCRELTTYGEVPRHGTIVADLKAAGYRTALIGKNHMLKNEEVDKVFDEKPPPGPTFQNYRVDDFDQLPPIMKALYQGKIEAPVDEIRDAISVDQLAEFLDTDSDKPFFAWVNFENSHPPYAAPDPFFSRLDREKVPSPKRCSFEDKPSWMRILHETWEVDKLSDAELREIKAVYHAQVEIVDEMVGRCMKVLQERGLLEDTLVVFTSDHGDFAGEFGLVEKWDTAFQEEIMHVPLIAAGACVENPGRETNALIENIDILPTVQEMVGLPRSVCIQHAQSFASILKADTDQHRPSQYAEGGVEETALAHLYPLASDQAYSGKHRALHRDPSILAAARMLRTQEAKLVMRSAGKHELYDLQCDPGECVNVFTDSAYEPLKMKMLEALALRTMAAAPRFPAIPSVGLMA